MDEPKNDDLTKMPRARDQNEIEHDVVVSSFHSEENGIFFKYIKNVARSIIRPATDTEQNRALNGKCEVSC